MWRATGWWPDHYSIAVFDIQKAKDYSLLPWKELIESVDALEDFI